MIASFFAALQHDNGLFFAILLRPEVPLFGLSSLGGRRVDDVTFFFFGSHKSLA